MNRVLDVACFTVFHVVVILAVISGLGLVFGHPTTPLEYVLFGGAAALFALYTARRSPETPGRFVDDLEGRTGAYERRPTTSRREAALGESDRT